MPPRNPVDLKQVGKLFEDTLAAIRDDAPDIDTLEPQAIAWLKASRYKIMREIETAYYTLERSRDTPLSHPQWVDPSGSIFISTDYIPVPLYPFKKEFCTNVASLMNDCGFSNCTVSSIMPTFISVQIAFPFRPQVAAHPGPAAVPRPLPVEDEFSRMGDGAPAGDRKPCVGGFAATDFVHLLVDARADTRGKESSASATTSGTNKRRRASRTVKDEIDDEEPRLRSVTRASSASTLRSSSGNLRRSSRKRVKTEE
ncbi:hypothetical protein C8J57DRAFT_1719706 [Mycena rebaudengoi]|nr:hypothetical protein C8J57DRAFT_1719706 [Mycena rebaudengoi]